MGWAGLLPTVLPWIQAFIWAFKPTDIVDIAIPKEEARAVDEEIAGGLHIDAQTAATRWRGERMDYGIAIDSLLYRTRRPGGVAPRPPQS